MGIFNSFGAMSGQFAAKQERLQVANALVEELQAPGKIAELLHSLDTAGQGALVQQWASGEMVAVTTTQLQQALQQSTLLEDLTRRTRMPVGVVKKSLAVLLPLSIGQLAQEGYVTAEGKASGKPLTSLTGLLDALR